MFDVGFWELTIIAILALVVVGPERLPKVISTVGRWVGKARAYVGGVRAEIEREVKKAERVAHENEALAELKDTARQLREDAEGLRTGSHAIADPVKAAAAAASGALPAEAEPPRVQPPAAAQDEDTAQRYSAIERARLRKSQPDAAGMPSAATAERSGETSSDRSRADAGSTADNVPPAAAEPMRPEQPRGR